MTKDATSMNLNLDQYVDIPGLKKALHEAGCLLPHDFNTIIDVHMRVLFHRYFKKEETIEKLTRDVMSRELRILLGGIVGVDSTGCFFLRNHGDYVIVWNSKFYKERRKKRRRQMTPEENALVEKVLIDDGPFAVIRSAEIRDLIPRSLKLRSGGRNALRFVFHGGTVYMTWADKPMKTGIIIPIKALADAMLVMGNQVSLRAVRALGRKALQVYNTDRSVFIFDKSLDRNKTR